MPDAEISAAAEGDLVAIWLYVYDRSESVRRARSVHADLRGTIDLLAQHPGMGRPREDIAPGMLVFFKHDYAILCRTVPEGILIVRVIGGEQDLVSVLERDP